MEDWHFLEHGRCSPPWNMACDEWLLKRSPHLKHPILRTYAWDRPSATIGYFQPFPADLPTHITVVRRPTGGALVLHDFDLTFSIILPSHHPWRKLGTSECYHCVHQNICKIFEKRGLNPTLATSNQVPPSGRASEADCCFAKKSHHDVLIRGTKVAGGAQRRTQNGLLHQGSIQGGDQPKTTPSELQWAWEIGGARFTKMELKPEEQAAISQLATNQFASREWNYRLKMD